MSIIKTDYVFENAGCFSANNIYLLLNQKLCKLRLLRGGKQLLKVVANKVYKMSGI